MQKEIYNGPAFGLYHSDKFYELIKGCGAKPYLVSAFNGHSEEGIFHLDHVVISYSYEVLAGTNKVKVLLAGEKGEIEGLEKKILLESKKVKHD